MTYVRPSLAVKPDLILVRQNFGVTGACVPDAKVLSDWLLLPGKCG